MTSESKIKKDIVAYLDSLGERCWHVAYHNMGYGRYGVPDRLVCYRGRFFAPEVKKKDGKARVRQETEHNAINAAGGIAVVVDDVEQVKAIIARIDDELNNSTGAILERMMLDTPRTFETLSDGTVRRKPLPLR